MVCVHERQFSRQDASCDKISGNDITENDQHSSGDTCAIGSPLVFQHIPTLADQGVLMIRDICHVGCRLTLRTHLTATPRLAVSSYFNSSSLSGIALLSGPKRTSPLLSALPSEDVPSRASTSTNSLRRLCRSASGSGSILQHGLDGPITTDRSPLPRLLPRVQCHSLWRNACILSAGSGNLAYRAS